jgi:hypothetical protein
MIDGLKRSNGQTNSSAQIGSRRDAEFVSSGGLSRTFSAFPGKRVFFIKSMSNYALPLCLAGQEDKP